MYWFFSVPVFQWSARLTQTPHQLAGHLLPCHWTQVAYDLVWMGTLARFRALPHIFTHFHPFDYQSRLSAYIYR